MSFAFSGSHRAGKTTTAKLVSSRMGLVFLDSNVSAELKASGFDQVSVMDLDSRMACQEARLALHMEKYLAGPRPLITDRSPLDLAAYALAECTMHSDPGYGAWAADYAHRCGILTRTYYGLIISARPLPAYVVEDGKPPENVGYQWHIQHLIEGMMSAVSGDVTTAWLTTFSLEDRVESACGVIQDSLDEMAKWRKKVNHRVH